MHDQPTCPQDAPGKKSGMLSAEPLSVDHVLDEILNLELSATNRDVSPATIQWTWQPSLSYEIGKGKLIWLVVGLPLWKIWVRQLGWWHKPNINGKINIWWQPFTTTLSHVKYGTKKWPKKYLQCRKDRREGSYNQLFRSPESSAHLRHKNRWDFSLGCPTLKSIES